MGSRRSRGEVDTIYAQARALAERVGIAVDLLPSADQEGREDGLWIEPVSEGRFERLYMERGERIPLGRGDAADTLFAALLSASQTEAGRREVRQRIKGQDSRRQWFRIQHDLMAAMKPEWGARTSAHHAEILVRAPFRDDEL